ncbi:MAG: hypothetical protein E6K95_06425 [Thaumarchaeota archaeon]|nr:MAG: hypothetical protein E6K95_06425 [Nitrososphaerota archaeon]
MSPLEEISSLLSGGGRVIVIAENEVDLKSLRGKNTLFLLKVAEGSLAAGGRGGGFGERRVVAVLAFRYEEGVCEKIFETAEEGTVSKFEVPYYVTRMPMTMSDGAESVGYGVVDPELVAVFAHNAR